MQEMAATQLEEQEVELGARPKKRQALADRRHFTHKRMERWIKLQQFVFGLPEDYSYAVCLREKPDGSREGRALVRVGWMCWYGLGAGVDRQHALAVALLNTKEALSSNSTLVFFHRIYRVLGSGLRLFRKGEKMPSRSREAASRETGAGLLAS